MHTMKFWIYIYKADIWRNLFSWRLTCIYAACKAEENHVSAEELGKGIEQDHHMILNNEMLVLQAWISHTLTFSYMLNMSNTLILLSVVAESRIWSHCLCTISRSWRLYRWYGGSFGELFLSKKRTTNIYIFSSLLYPCILQYSFYFLLHIFILYQCHLMEVFITL